MKFINLFIFLGLLFAGCSSSNQQNNSSGVKAFFDLNGYITSEIDRLSDKSISKEIKIDGKLETLKIDDVNWEKELAVFFESDINKDAWVNEFSKEEKRGVTSYTTENKNIVTKKLQIVKDSNGDVNKIFITREKENLLYKSVERISYRPTFGFQILADRKIIFNDPQKIEITVQFER